MLDLIDVNSDPHGGPLREALGVVVLGAVATITDSEPEPGSSADEATQTTGG